MRKLLYLSLSIKTFVTLKMICENHKVKMSDLISRVLEVADDELLLKAVEPISKVLNERV